MLPNIVTTSAMKCFNENTEYKEVLARRYSMHMQFSRFLGISRLFVKLKNAEILHVLCCNTVGLGCRNKLDELKPLNLETMWTCSNLMERPGHLSRNALTLARNGRISSGGSKT